jgi:hypothetical protein
MSLLRGRRYNRAKKTHGGEREASHQNEDLRKTSEVLAEQHGVSKATIERDGKLAEACERFGIEYQTAAQATRVAAAFESCTRVQDLTFNHHQIVAGSKQAKSSAYSTSHFF